MEVASGTTVISDTESEPAVAVDSVTDSVRESSSPTEVGDSEVLATVSPGCVEDT